MSVFDMPVRQPLVDVVCGSVSYGSTVYTDEYRSYDPLDEHGFVHECVSHSGKEYARGDVHVNNCECSRSNLCQMWLRKFMGVNRHNMQAYMKSFQFVHNLRDKTREERFRRILCYNQLKHL
ncbi:MAG: transposase [Nitrososphaera sp.]|jgi:transposase-like protein